MNRKMQYLKSLMDNRNVWLYGKRVNILEAEAFQGTLNSITELFHMLDSPTEKKLVGYKNDEGQYVHLSFLIPQCYEDLKKRKNAFSIWAEATDGMMSRLSDYSRSRLTGWYASKNEMMLYDSQFASKVESYYCRARDENRFITLVQRDPQVNREKQYNDSFFEESGLLRVVNHNEEGVYVSGSKMSATGAPYTNEFIIFPVMALSPVQKKAANMFIVPADSKGLHIVCREPYSRNVAKKEDYPLSSQYDEMDALLIFDHVFIPWEHVLIFQDPEALIQIKKNLYSNSLAYHQAIIRLKTKIEFLTGLAFIITESIGSTSYLHVQEKLGELIGYVDTLNALLIAAETEGEVVQGIYLPNFSYIETARNLGASLYSRVIEIIQLLSAGGLIQVPSSMDDFASPLSELMKLHYRGANIDAKERVKLFKLAWDVVGSPFASRHELYERFYAGDPIRNKAAQYLSFNKQKLIDKVRKYIN